MRLIILAVLMCVCQAALDPENCQPPALNGGFFIPNSESYRTKDKISYGCNTGLKPDLKTWWGEITCKNGEWSHTPRCINKTWCITTYVPNAKPDVVQAAAPGTHDFECDHGYWIGGGKSTAECVAGSWTLPECKRKPDFCAPPPRVNNGMITTPYRNIFEDGEKLEYICARGYRLVGDKTSICEHGTWSSNPRCVEVKCTERPHVYYARAAEELKGSYYDGETVKFICNRDYEFEGANTARCEDGTWKLPVCKVKCTDRPYVAYARAAEGFKYSYNHGDTVRFICDRNYEFEGRDTAQCEDGNWKAPVCKDVRCSAPRVPNGRPEDQSKAVYTDREYVTVVCDRGYEVKNRYPYGQCVRGTWTLPVCEAQAPTPCSTPHVPNAQPVEPLSWYPYPTGRTVTFTCNRGYEFERTNKALCHDGVWMLPVCKRAGGAESLHPDLSGVLMPVSDCGSHPLIENGDVIQQSHGMELKVQCARYYKLVGPKKVGCVQGEWTELPVCNLAAGEGAGEFRPDQFADLLPVHICGTHPLIANGDVTEMTSGKELKVQCVKLHKLDGPKTVACVHGKWTALPVCKPPCTVEGERINSRQSDYVEDGDEKRYSCGVFKKITVKCLDGTPSYSECQWSL